MSHKRSYNNSSFDRPDLTHGVPNALPSKRVMRGTRGRHETPEVVNNFPVSDEIFSTPMIMVRLRYFRSPIKELSPWTSLPLRMPYNRQLRNRRWWIRDMILGMTSMENMVPGPTNAVFVLRHIPRRADGVDKKSCRFTGVMIPLYHHELFPVYR